MSELQEQQRAGNELPVSPWIVRREIIDVKNHAEQLLSEAKIAADRVLAQATAQAAGLRKASERQGLREGIATAAALIAKVSADLEAYRTAREAEIGTLAFAIAHRILGTFPEDDRLLRAVQTALDDHRNTTGLRLRASPEIASMLRTFLEGEAGASVAVEVDETAPPSSCSLIHPRGRIAIGPIDQLLAMLASASGSVR
jgi:flagellar biosynthesis/type III secretory pathway protein FliH